MNQEKNVYLGPSGKTIYVDGKELIRKGEMTRAISQASKKCQNSGARKLTQRIRNHFVGCSEKDVVNVKANSKSLKVK